MLLGYCVRREGDPPPAPGLTGLADQPVTLVEASGLGLWMSTGNPVRPTPDALHRHEAVIQQALQSATPLPLRFGAVFQDENAVWTTLRERRDEFLASLDRVAGKVEMRVQLLLREPESRSQPREEVHTGREFLEARRRELRRVAAQEREAEESIRVVEQHFVPLELPTARVLASAPPLAGTVAHLVRWSELNQYRECAARAQRAAPRLRLRVSGPWAPYSFV